MVRDGPAEHVDRTWDTMPSYLIGSLTADAAGHICMTVCHAMCCRGPIILTLTEEEALAFQHRATEMAIPLLITRGTSGAWLRFSDHPGERCPMLEDGTFRCLKYEDRPQRCRDFPNNPTPGCVISGG